MSATEELRALLDERGVEYRWDNGIVTWYAGGVMYNAWRYDNERLTMSVCYLNPAQAIVATLGRGTCKLSRGTSGLMHVTTGHCSECGAEVVKGTKDGYRSRYCQWCGAKVVGL